MNLELRIRTHDAFMEMGNLYERLGDEYRSEAYYNAAEAVLEKRELSLRMMKKVELIKAGIFKYPQRLRDLQLLAEIPGFGKKTILSYSNKYPEKSAKEILHIIKAEKGLTKVQQAGIKYYKQIKRSLSREVIDAIVGNIRGDEHFEVAGSYRRGKLDGMGDIDILCLDTIFEALTERFKKLPEHVVDLADGDRRYTFLYRYKNAIKKDSKIFYTDEESERTFLVQIDVRGISAESYPFALFYFTGSKDFNVMCRRNAKSQGYILNEYGLYRGKERVEGLESEQQIIDKLGIDSSYYDPKNRNI